MPNITNSAGLKSALMNIAKDAIKKVSNDISDNNVTDPSVGGNMGYLQKMIFEKTYTWDYFPNVRYYTPIQAKRSLLQEYILTDDIPSQGAMPTFQFFRSFKWKPIKISVDEVSRELFYDWQSMQQDPATYLHANPIHGDMRDELADILNVDGSPSSFPMGKSRKPFWDITIAELFGGDGIKSLFDMYLIQP